jgi:hypothetical protein
MPGEEDKEQGIYKKEKAKNYKKSSPVESGF